MPRGSILLRRRFSPRPFLFTFCFCQIKQLFLYFLTFEIEYCGNSCSELLVVYQIIVIF